MSNQQSRQRIPELLELVGLTPHAHKKLETFSKGMQQRIGLAQALLNDPALVILDEPTSGLDPVGRRLVRDIIRNLRDGGTTVFLNSHLLSEIEITCDRVGFIKQGKVVKLSRLNTLLASELSVEIRAKNLKPETINGLSRWAASVRVEEETLWLTITSEEDVPALNRYLVEQGAEVYALQPKRSSLEELFIQIVGTDGGE
jgi:ABC-2 type transport system ATP-binding protein